MGDDSKAMVSASAFATKKEHPSCDYSTPITSDKLDDNNYASWSRGVRITITSRRMASWINGKKPALSSDSAAYVKWEEDNCLVQSWLLNSMTKLVRALFEHGDTAFDIWEAARKTYIEIDCLCPHEFSCVDDGGRRLKEVEADRVYDFLGGLDPPYDGVRSRILALSPVPPPLEAYAMVMEEDIRQSAMLGRGSMALKVDPTRQQLVTQHDMTDRSLSRKFSSSAGSHPSGSTPSFLDSPPKCRHCNGNHYSKKCFKEHGMGSNTWIIDTGASDHMTYNDNMFDELSHNLSNPYITSANGLPSPVTREGSQDSLEDWAWCLGVLLMFMSTLINGVNLIRVLSAASSLAIIPLRRVTSAITLLAIDHQAIYLKQTGRSDGDDRPHASMTDDCQETTGLPEEATGHQAICLEPIGRSEGNDCLPVEFLDNFLLARRM
ncbi:hypothetical protein L3X38_030071 [Prunus dulcis]|uniref:Retrotransposon Copia-like N-terminal domain-containing protein n=2 Tax=Prunus dulcis TaxID=3755 RepID=A0AAD4VU54_PRUDU|nr:hypothetical protein L3X38_030071 [Prunus dulcis]